MAPDDSWSFGIIQAGRTRPERVSRTDKGFRAGTRAFPDLPVSAFIFAGCVASTEATVKLRELLTSGVPLGVPEVVVGG